MDEVEKLSLRQVLTPSGIREDEASFLSGRIAPDLRSSRANSELRSSPSTRTTRLWSLKGEPRRCRRVSQLADQRSHAVACRSPKAWKFPLRPNMANQRNIDRIQRRQYRIGFTPATCSIFSPPRPTAHQIELKTKIRRDAPLADESYRYRYTHAHAH